MIRYYCSESCQEAHWHFHKKVCQKGQTQPTTSMSSPTPIPRTPYADAPSTSGSTCPECSKTVCSCDERPACTIVHVWMVHVNHTTCATVGWVCLESERGGLLRGCACRGSAGWVHVSSAFLNFFIFNKASIDELMLLCPRITVPDHPHHSEPPLRVILCLHFRCWYALCGR